MRFQRTRFRDINNRRSLVGSYREMDYRGLRQRETPKISRVAPPLFSRNENEQARSNEREREADLTIDERATLPAAAAAAAA